MSVHSTAVARRNGFLKIEAMIAAVILVAAMSFATKSIHRINQVWNQTRQYQFAINEISNRLDALVDLSPEEAKSALDSLAPTAACKDVLGSPKFLTSIDNDELGTRITIKLAWQKKQPNAPQLSAWLIDGENEGADQ